MAADVYARSPKFRGDAKRYKSRAVKAWNWAEANPNIIFKNNDAEQGSEGLAAGQQEVEGERLQKKILMSAIYMFQITKDRKYARLVEILYREIKPITPYASDGFEGDIAPTLLYFAGLNGVSRRFSSQIRRDYEAAITGESGVWQTIAR